MVEQKVEFAPANGGAAQPITLRIHTPVQGPESWSARIEVIGFEEPYSWATQGEDWAQVIELAAELLPVVLQSRVAAAGGGTLDPDFYERDPQPPDLSKLPPEVAALLRTADDASEGSPEPDSGRGELPK